MSFYKWWENLFDKNMCQPGSDEIFSPDFDYYDSNTYGLFIIIFSIDILAKTKQRWQMGNNFGECPSPAPHFALLT